MMVYTFFLISIYGRGVNGFSSREPFKYYVIIGLGGWVQKMAILLTISKVVILYKTCHVTSVRLRQNLNTCP